MTYNEKDGHIHLDLTQEEYSELLYLLGIATGALENDTGWHGMYRAVEFVNELNRANPGFTPYEIPEEYRKKVP